MVDIVNLLKGNTIIITCFIMNFLQGFTKNVLW